jgi:hypothetical protein
MRLGGAKQGPGILFNLLKLLSGAWGGKESGPRRSYVNI